MSQNSGLSKRGRGEGRGEEKKGREEGRKGEVRGEGTKSIFPMQCNAALVTIEMVSVAAAS